MPAWTTCNIHIEEHPSLVGSEDVKPHLLPLCDVPPHSVANVALNKAASRGSFLVKAINLLAPSTCACELQNSCCAEIACATLHNNQVPAQ